MCFKSNQEMVGYFHSILSIFLFFNFFAPVDISWQASCYCVPPMGEIVHYFSALEVCIEH